MTSTRGFLAAVMGVAIVVVVTLQVAHQRSTAVASSALPVCRVHT